MLCGVPVRDLQLAEAEFIVKTGMSDVQRKRWETNFLDGANTMVRSTQVPLVTIDDCIRERGDVGAFAFVLRNEARR